MIESNASLLSLLTISTEESETIFFALCKEVDDIAPLKKYWYKSLGQDGLADFIWKDKNIKQWLLIGLDSEVQAIFNELIDKSIYIQSWSNSSRRFLLPKLEIIEKEDNHLAIKGIPVCARDNYPDEYYSNDTFPKDISFLLGEDNNCAFIEGYKFHDKIKTISPPALLGENSLKRYLEKSIYGVFKKRSIYCRLRGDRSTHVEGDPIKYKGFIQANKKFKLDNRICIRDLEGSEILGISDIDSDGRWEMELIKPVFRGQVLIQEKATDTFICGEKFYLLKDIKINTEIINTLFKDLFNRIIHVGKKDKVNKELGSLIWDSNNAPDSIQSQIELSDKLTDVISSLGKKIVFNDPYFWGDFTANNEQLDISISQKIFLNALITSIAKTEIEEILIIGYWKRANNYITGDKTELEKKYKLIYSLIKKIFETHSILNIKRFELIFSKEPFHDRYWIGEDNVYHVSNSINGIFESGELTIKKEDKLGQLKIRSRVITRQSKGEIINLIF